jgi:hypothetical protein
MRPRDVALSLRELGTDTMVPPCRGMPRPTSGCRRKPIETSCCARRLAACLWRRSSERPSRNISGVH